MSHAASNAMATPTAILLEESALQPPEGVIPHLTNRSPQQSWYYVFVSLCTVFTGVLLMLRLYTKLRIFRKVDITDCLVALAFLFLISLIVIGREIIAQGGAVHQWNVQLKHLIQMQYLFYVGEILYGPTIFWVKAAILLQYQRILAPTKSVNALLFYSSRAIIGVTLVYYIISTSITIFACSPREKLWNPLITEGQCLSNDTLVLITCMFNIISDIIILILPARSVWRLRMSLRKKIPIILLFAIGVLACIANIMIIYYAVHMGGDNADVSYNAAFMGCWAYVEISLGIIVICSIPLPKLYETKGKKVRNFLSDITRPFTSFSSLATLLRSARHGTTISDRTTRTGATKIQTPSEYDISLDLTTCHLSWPDVPPLPAHNLSNLTDQYQPKYQPSWRDQKQDATPV